MKGGRRLARELALQVLYEVDVTTHPVGVVLQRGFERDTEAVPLVHEYCQELVVGVLGCSGILDQYIQQHASQWPLEQVAVVDRNLLRMALYEFAVGGVPYKVAINESVELAKTFGGDSAPRFINGVLGALLSQSDEIRQVILESGQTELNEKN